MNYSRQRSAESHSHYFAQVADGWLNLPDEYAGIFPSPGHLRKRLLIEAGYCDEKVIVYDTPEMAALNAALVKPAKRFVMIEVSDCVVRMRYAQSQSLKAMGAEEFQQSKEAVLTRLAEMLGVDAEEFKREAGMAA